MSFPSRDRDRVLVLMKRQPTVWGGTAMLNAFLDAVRILGNRYPWTYLINLSGMDYPIKNGYLLADFLTRNQPKSFLRLSRSRRRRSKDRQGLGYTFTQCDGRMWRVGKAMADKPHEDSLKMDFGSDWFCIHRSMLKPIWTNDPFTACMIDRWQTVLYPLESFFAVLLQYHNLSHLVTNDDLRLVAWQRNLSCPRSYCHGLEVVDWCGCSALYFTAEHFDRIRSSRAFFARKFDSTFDSTILDRIDSEILGGIGNAWHMMEKNGGQSSTGGLHNVNPVRQGPVHVGTTDKLSVDTPYMLRSHVLCRYELGVDEHDPLLENVACASERRGSQGCVLHNWHDVFVGSRLSHCLISITSTQTENQTQLFRFQVSNDVYRCIPLFELGQQWDPFQRRFKDQSLIFDSQWKPVQIKINSALQLLQFRCHSNGSVFGLNASVSSDPVQVYLTSGMWTVTGAVFKDDKHAVNPEGCSITVTVHPVSKKILHQHSSDRYDFPSM